MQYKLSILIPTIAERSQMLDYLQIKLLKQIVTVNTIHPNLGKVQICIDDSPKFLDGGKTVGQKRDDLVQQAEGEYLCFLDDDDDIPANYIETILRAIESKADIITFRSLFKCDYYWTIIDMSLAFGNEEANPEEVVKRSAWHICPMRSEIAKKHRFNTDKNNAEDWDWMSRVLQDIKTQHKTNIILHQYNHSSTYSAVDAIYR